ncbi:MAG: DUF4091 domain-containing protein [Tannerella sp.]|jgi:hypothetical protein|nr:DUF4091 domain-containing protein [Tannerella sp.]
MRQFFVLVNLLIITAIQPLFAQQVFLSWSSSDVRYSERNVPDASKPVTRISLTTWRGERINAQSVLIPKTDMSGVKVVVSDLNSSSAVIPASAISTFFVRYVMTDELNKDGKGGCGVRPNKQDWDSLMVADMLDNKDIVDLNAGEIYPIWMKIWTPADAKPGKYKGTLLVTDENQLALTLNIELEVLNRTLPAPKEWGFHLDLWQNPYSAARIYGVPLWSDAHFEAMRPTMKTLADAGQKVITATIMHKPWNGQTEDFFDAMVNKIKCIDGTWKYDYTVFDRWVEFMMSLGIDRQINCYTLIPWALSFDYFDQATNRIQFVKAEPGSQAYSDYWSAFVKDFASHLRQKGWFEKTCIAMDERGLEAMKEAIKLIRSVEPEFKISLAGAYHAEIADEIHDLCLSFNHFFPESDLEARKSAGKISTVYTCCAEARPNTFTFSPPSEAASLGWFALAGNYDGYLRWAYNSWTADPVNDSRFRTWAAGDCYLVYPDGHSSIRMERLIEGIQDYEKFKILQKEYVASKSASKLNLLNRILSLFTAENLEREGSDAIVAKARAILNMKN